MVAIHTGTILRCAGVAWLMALTCGIRAQDPDVTRLAALRGQHEFEQAASYCREQLGQPLLPPARRMRLTVEWIRTLAEQALHATPEHRDRLWQAAEQVYRDYSGQTVPRWRVQQVQSEYAMAILVKGEIARMESLVAPDAAVHVDRAKSEFREAIRHFEQLGEELARSTPGARPSSPLADEWTVPEYESLRANVRYQLARAFRSQAECFPNGSPDRLLALTQAMEQLDELSRRPLADPLFSQRVRLDQALCRLLADDTEDLARELDLLDTEGMDAPIRLRARAERIRQCLRSGRWEDASARMALGRSVGDVTFPELDLARLETALAMWRRAAETRRDMELATWRSMSVETVHLIDTAQGSYGSRRANDLLSQYRGPHFAARIDFFMRSAEELFLRGRFEEALDAFEQAATAAEDKHEAFVACYKAALLQQQRQRHDEASRRFRDAALRHVEHPQAANAHLLSIVNFAQGMRQEPDARADHYRELLQEHLRHWPGSTTTNFANAWLGGVLERAAEWSQALQAYRSVSHDSDAFAEAMLGAERCWIQVLSARPPHESVEAEANRAAMFFEQAVDRAAGGGTAAWDDARRNGALAAARIRWQFTANSAARAERLLLRAIEGQPPPPPTWLETARPLLIELRCHQPGRLEDAIAIVREFRTDPYEKLLALLMRLDLPVPRATAETAGQRARVQLAILDLIAEKTPDGEVLPLALARIRSRALVAAGDRPLGLARLAELARQYPDDREIQVELAVVLADSSDEKELRQALEQWRLVADRSPISSEGWYRAKYSVATTLWQLGAESEARKLIRFVLTMPRIEMSGWRDRFADLLKQYEGG